MPSFLFLERRLTNEHPKTHRGASHSWGAPYFFCYMLGNDYVYRRQHGTYRSGWIDYSDEFVLSYTINNRAC